jgi:hypothetical protein
MAAANLKVLETRAGRDVRLNTKPRARLLRLAVRLPSVSAWPKSHDQGAIRRPERRPYRDG